MQQRHLTSTGAIAVVLVPIAAFLVSFALAPLSIVMASVSTVMAVRGARRGGPDLTWWRLGVVLGVLCVAASVAAIVVAVASRG